MSGEGRELRAKAADSEKITINLGYVDLGHIVTPGPRPLGNHVRDTVYRCPAHHGSPAAG